MTYNELKNIQCEFISLSNDLLGSIEDTFNANLIGFRDFCDSTQVIIDILKPISETNFDGIEYFNEKANLEYKFDKITEPKTRNELIKIPYDLLLKYDLNAGHIIDYAVWVLNPGTNMLDELLRIGNNELLGRLIKYIDVELTKLINAKNESIAPNQVNFNIENAHGSIIGTQTNATINNGITFDEIAKCIQSKDIDASDKQQLLELTNCLKTLTENNIPMSKGALAKFSDIVSKHSWSLTLIGNALIKHFVS